MISFLCVDIGRGHPFYQDGIVRALRRSGRGDLVHRCATVFDVSRGLARIGWTGARSAYHLAGRGGWIGRRYTRTRDSIDYERDSAALRLLGRDLRPWAEEGDLLVVNHPILVAALRGLGRVWYVHGDPAAPRIAVVSGAERVLVPTEEVAEAYRARGIDGVSVTGLCVENELLADGDRWAGERLARLEGSDPLTIGFFSSGAEPLDHVAVLAEGARSVARAGHRAIVFAGRGGRLAEATGALDPRSRGEPPERVVYGDREELDAETARRFGELDAVVSPAHERCAWALGLGVPFVLVRPDLGPYPPANREVLRRAGVVIEVDSVAQAQGLGHDLEKHRAAGTLHALSRRGRGLPVDGFPISAGLLAEAAG